MAIQDDIDRLVGIQGFSVSEIAFSEEKATLLFSMERRDRVYRCRCGWSTDACYDSRKRSVRDLSFGPFVRVFVTFEQCRIRCSSCGVRTEHLDWVGHRVGYTSRLAGAVALACREIRSIKAIAQQFHLHWDTVKKIDRTALQEGLPPIGSTDAKLLMVDEFAIRRGHRYGSIIADALTSEVLFVAEGRDADALAPFFDALGPDKCAKIEAIAMDAWRAFSKARRRFCPNAAMVYDQFHLLQIYSRLVLDRVRIDAYQEASAQKRKILKGAKYLLLKNTRNLLTERDEPARLHDILALNEQLNTVYTLKEDLKQVWRYKRRAWAEKWLDDWLQRARESRIKPLIQFTKKIIEHRESILAHCNYPIHTSRIEGMNNKVKVIKRIAFGFRDFEYFALKIRGAFTPIHYSA